MVEGVGTKIRTSWKSDPCTQMKGNRWNSEFGRNSKVREKEKKIIKLRKCNKKGFSDNTVARELYKL